MFLIIDTSTDFASLGLAEAAGILAETTWCCGQSHTIQLLPQLEKLLSQNKLTLRDTRAVVVARGPGSFNGLRVGMSVAKGLAFALSVPLVGISTLEAEAYLHSDADLPVCAVFDAGRGEIAAALFRLNGSGWRRLVDEHITTLEGLSTLVTGPTVFCGDPAEKMKSALVERLGDCAVVPPTGSAGRRLRPLAQLGMKRLEAGDTDNVATLQPLYLRRPHITERQHL